MSRTHFIFSLSREVVICSMLCTNVVHRYKGDKLVDFGRMFDNGGERTALDHRCFFFVPVLAARRLATAP
jgi:hypothetical protein